MVPIMVAEQHRGPNFSKDFGAIADDPVCKMLLAAFYARLELAGVSASQSCALLCCCWESEYPGDFVLWAYTVKRLADRLDSKQITATDLCYAFASGIPTKEGRSKIWAQQKVKGKHGGINLLDCREIWTGEPIEEAP
jgi:hypothetical protein